MSEKKKLSGFDLFLYCVGGTIGSGIFVLMPYAVGDTGRSLPIAIVVAIALMMCAYFYNIVLASMFPLKGGDYSHVAFLSSPTMMGVYAMMTVTTNFGIAGLATSCISYASSVFPFLAGMSKPVGFVLLTVFFLINVKGAKFGAKFENAMSIALIVALAGFTIMGLPKVKWGELFQGEGFLYQGWHGLFGAIAMMSFASQGPSAVGAALAADTRKPTRTVPRIIFLSTIVVAVLYLGMGVVAVGALPIEQVAYQDLTVVAKEVFPNWFFVFFVLGGAVCALLTSVLSQITTARYPLMQMADEGWLPAVFKKKTKSGFPYVIMGTLYIITMIPLIFDISYDVVVSFVCVPMTLFLVYVNLVCIKLPKMYPAQWKHSVLHMPYPLYVCLMVFSALCSAFATYTFASDITEVSQLVILAVVCLAIVFYTKWRLKKGYVKEQYLLDQKQAIITEIEELIAQEEAQKS